MDGGLPPVSSVSELKAILRSPVPGRLCQIHVKLDRSWKMQSAVISNGWKIDLRSAYTVVFRKIYLQLILTFEDNIFSLLVYLDTKGLVINRHEGQ